MLSRKILLCATLLTAPVAVRAAPIEYRADVLPANGSGVTGFIDFLVNDNTMSVDLELTGLAPGVHYLHVHGKDSAPGVPVNTPAPTPPVPPNGDANGDGVVNTPEAKSTSGPVILSLAPHPAGTVGEFVGVTSMGSTLSFQMTYDLTNSGIYEPGFTEADLLPLSDRVFDLHGGIVPLNSNPNDGQTLAPGTFDPNLPVGAGKILLVTAVPEPTTLALLALPMTLAGLVVTRRRRAAGTA